MYFFLQLWAVCGPGTGYKEFDIAVAVQNKKSIPLVHLKNMALGAMDTDIILTYTLHYNTGMDLRVMENIWNEILSSTNWIKLIILPGGWQLTLMEPYFLTPLHFYSYEKLME